MLLIKSSNRNFPKNCLQWLEKYQMPRSVAVSCTYSEHKLIGSSTEISLGLKG